MKLPTLLRRRNRPPWPMCRDLMERVTDYLEGTMTAEEVAAVEAHLAGCDGCTQAVEQFRMTIVITGQLTADEVADVEPEVFDELLAAFRRRPTDPTGPTGPTP